MATKHVHAAGKWIVVTDAGAACKTEPTWGAFVMAYRIHLDTTSAPPSFEGAFLSRVTGINRAEFQATIMGLRTLLVAMTADEWGARPILVVTDSDLVFKCMTGAWRAQALRALKDDCFEACTRLTTVTGAPVMFQKGIESEVRPTDILSRRFRNVCDEAHVKEWNDKQASAKKASRQGR